MNLLAVITAAILHELGHIIAIILCGGRLRRLSFTLSGAVIDAELSGLDPRRRAAVYFAGAFSNIVSGFVGLFLGFREFAAISFLLGIVNLLPIKLLDGGCLISELVGQSRALDILSHATIFVLWLSSIVSLILYGNLSLWLFTSCLFVEMYLRVP